MLKKPQVMAWGFALYVLCTTEAHATLMVDLDVSFNEDVRLTGMFDAQDLNNDLVITQDEVSTITATYHPSLNDPFYPTEITLTTPSAFLSALEFDLTTLLLRRLRIEEGVSPENTTIDYSATRPWDPIGACIPETCNEFGYVELGQANVVTATGVPEPTTIALLSLGLAGVGFTRRRMKA